MTSQERGNETQKDIKDLAGGALVDFVGKFGRAFRGAFLWVVTLLCGLEVQALYSLSWGLVSVLNRVARFGLQRGVVRFVVIARMAGNEEEVERSLGASLRIGLIASAFVVGLLLLSAEWVAAFYSKPIAETIRIMAWAGPFMTITSIFVAATRALRFIRFDVYVRSIAGPLILLVGGLIAGFLSPKLESIAWVQLSMALGMSLLATFYFRRFFSLVNCLRRLGRAAPWGKLGRFSAPVMLTDLLHGVLTQLDVLMLGWFVAKEQMYLVGIFVLSRRIASAILKVPQAFDPIFSSIVPQLSSQERHQELAHRFVSISRWILTVNLPIFAGILIIGNSLLPMLAGKEVLTLSQADIQAGLDILFLLCIGMMVQGISAAVEPLLVMSGRPYLNLMNNSLWLGLNFLLNIGFIKIYGILGAALGAALSMSLISVVRFLQVYIIYRIQPFRSSLLKPVLSVLGAALAGWLIQNLVPAGAAWASIAAPLVGFLGVYILLLLLLGIEEEDKVLLRLVYRRALRVFNK